MVCNIVKSVTSICYLNVEDLTMDRKRIRDSTIKDFFKRKHIKKGIISMDLNFS